MKTPFSPKRHQDGFRPTPDPVVTKSPANPPPAESSTNPMSPAKSPATFDPKREAHPMVDAPRPAKKDAK